MKDAIVQEEELGQLLGVDAIVLARGAKDQAELTRMGHDNPPGDPPKPLEEHAIARGRFEADRKGPFDPFELRADRRPRSLDGPAS